MAVITIVKVLSLKAFFDLFIHWHFEEYYYRIELSYCLKIRVNDLLRLSVQTLQIVI